MLGDEISMKDKKEHFKVPPTNYYSTNTNISELAYFIKHVGETIMNELQTIKEDLKTLESLVRK